MAPSFTTTTALQSRFAVKQIDRIEQIALDHSEPFAILREIYSQTITIEADTQHGRRIGNISKIPDALAFGPAGQRTTRTPPARRTRSLTAKGAAESKALAREKVDFYPRRSPAGSTSLLPLVGTKVSAPLGRSARGAGSRGVPGRQQDRPRARLRAGLLPRRRGRPPVPRLEGGALPPLRRPRLSRVTGCWRTPAGSGIPNCTHNNTRGHITRLLEEELVAAANGLRGSGTALHDTDRRRSGGSWRRRDAHVINRVINLETGSLAVEAALKMVLRRFYRFEKETERPPLRRAHPGPPGDRRLRGRDRGELPRDHHAHAGDAGAVARRWRESSSPAAPCSCVP